MKNESQNGHSAEISIYEANSVEVMVFLFHFWLFGKFTSFPHSLQLAFNKSGIIFALTLVFHSFHWILFQQSANKLFKQILIVEIISSINFLVDFNESLNNLSLFWKVTLGHIAEIRIYMKLEEQEQCSFFLRFRLFGIFWAISYSLSLAFNYSCIIFIKS